MSSRNINAYPLTARQMPTNGSKAIERVMDFTAVTTLTQDLMLEEESGHFGDLQSLKIDNSKNAAAFTIAFPGVGAMGDVVTCPPFTILYAPVMVPPGKVIYVATTTGGVKVPVMMFNIEIPYFSYSAVSATSGVITGAETNFSGTNTGASQAVFASNLNAKRRVIQNPQINNNSMWIKIGAPATADNFSQEIAPGQQYDTTTGPLSTGALNIIGTLGEKYYASEIA